MSQEVDPVSLCYLTDNKPENAHKPSPLMITSSDGHLVWSLGGGEGWLAALRKTQGNVVHY